MFNRIKHCLRAGVLVVTVALSCGAVAQVAEFELDEQAVQAIVNTQQQANKSEQDDGHDHVPEEIGAVLPLTARAFCDEKAKSGYGWAPAGYDTAGKVEGPRYAFVFTEGDIEDSIRTFIEFAKPEYPNVIYDISLHRAPNAFCMVGNDVYVMLNQFVSGIQVEGDEVNVAFAKNMQTAIVFYKSNDEYSELLKGRVL